MFCSCGEGCSVVPKPAVPWANPECDPRWNQYMSGSLPCPQRPMYRPVGPISCRRCGARWVLHCHGSCQSSKLAMPRNPTRTESRHRGDDDNGIFIMDGTAADDVYCALCCQSWLPNNLQTTAFFVTPAWSLCRASASIFLVSAIHTVSRCSTLSVFFKTSKSSTTILYCT